jgi:hypothetical protein
MNFVPSPEIGHIKTIGFVIGILGILLVMLYAFMGLPTFVAWTGLIISIIGFLIMIFGSGIMS